MFPFPDAASAARAIHDAIARHSPTDPELHAIQGELEEVLSLVSSGKPARPGADPVGRATDLFERSKQASARKAQRLAYSVKVLAELVTGSPQGGKAPPDLTSQPVAEPRKSPAAEAAAPYQEGRNALPMDADAASMLRDIQENLEDVEACST